MCSSDLLVVDAWCAPTPEATPSLGPLRPAGAEPGGELGVAAGHALEPAALLAMASLFADAPPPAWLLLVPAFAFAHGTVWSAALRRQLPAARLLLEGWLAAEQPDA